MFFNRKGIKCDKCKSSLKEEFSYCPYCGNSMINFEKEKKDFGMLGRNDSVEEESMNKQFSEANMGFLDKIMESAMNSIMKSMEKEVRKSMSGEGSITPLPNGIKIRIGAPHSVKTEKKEKVQRKISEEQINRMSKMPRTTAKTNVRRLSDKIVYELAIPGINSPEDVFVSKLEQGYEIKAIGKSKVYINSLPIELPIKGFAINDSHLLVEFKMQE